MYRHKKLIRPIPRLERGAADGPVNNYETWSLYWQYGLLIY